MSLTTPDTIRTLQRKLYAKAKQEPAYRFYALYDKITGKTSSVMPGGLSGRTEAVPVWMGSASRP
jgi:hypothetical protein